MASLPPYEDAVRSAPLMRLDSGIYLPYTRGAGDAFLRHTAVTVGFRAVYGRRGDWDELAQLLGRFSVGQLLDVLSRINAVLYLFHGESARDPDDLLIRALFGGRAAPVFDAKSRIAAETGGASRCFNELQLVTAAKAIFLTQELGDDDRGSDFSHFGDALLLINDLANPDEEEPQATSRERHLYLLANGLFHHEENELAVIARSDLVFRSDRTVYRAADGPRSLRSVTEEASGLSTEAFWAIVFATQAHWRKYPVERLRAEPGAFNRETYIQSNYRFSRDELEAFYAVTLTEAEVMQAAVRRHYAPERLRPFHVLPFAAHPLIGFGTRAFCPSWRLHLDKIGAGLVHVVLAAPSTAGAPRDEYLRALGEAFSLYALDLLSPAFEGSGRLIDLDAALAESGRENEEPLADCVVVYGNTLVVIEFKAKLYPLDVRSGENWDAYDEKFRDTFVEAARQIDATTRRIRVGEFRHAGIPAEMAARILPVCVTLEDLPMNPFLFDKMQEDVESAGYLRATGVMPLCAMDVGDFEYASLAAIAGSPTLLELLDGHRASEYRKMSMGHFLWSRKYPSINAHHPLLEPVFSRLSQGSLSFFQRRQKVPSDEGAAE